MVAIKIDIHLDVLEVAAAGRDNFGTRVSGHVLLKSMTIIHSDAICAFNQNVECRYVILCWFFSIDYLLPRQHWQRSSIDSSGIIHTRLTVQCLRLKSEASSSSFWYMHKRANNNGMERRILMMQTLLSLKLLWVQTLNPKQLMNIAFPIFSAVALFARRILSILSKRQHS